MYLYIKHIELFYQTCAVSYMHMYKKTRKNQIIVSTCHVEKKRKNTTRHRSRTNISSWRHEIFERKNSFAKNEKNKKKL